MAYRNPGSQSEHDRVIAASARTYWKMEQQGYQVSTNPGPQKNCAVGGTRALYPDVVVVKPETPGSSRGTAVIIEEVETADSVTETEAKQWQNFASLGIGTFRLIVPTTSTREALALVQQFRIAVNEIWGYFFESGEVKFQKYTS